MKAIEDDIRDRDILKKGAAMNSDENLLDTEPDEKNTSEDESVTENPLPTSPESEPAREATPQASSAQPPTLQVSEEKRRKQIHFAAGFLGWFLINGAVWLLSLLCGLYDEIEQFGAIVIMIIFPLNILTVVALGVIRRTRTIALGILAAWAVNLIISLVMGSVGNGVCLIPFFLR